MFFFSNWLILLASLSNRAILYKSRFPEWLSALFLVGEDLFCFIFSSLCVVFCFSVSRSSISLEYFTDGGFDCAYSRNRFIWGILFSQRNSIHIALFSEDTSAIYASTFSANASIFVHCSFEWVKMRGLIQPYFCACSKPGPGFSNDTCHIFFLCPMIWD